MPSPYNIQITPAHDTVDLDALKSDTVELDKPVRAIYVGTPGNIVLVDLSGNTRTFVGAQAGSEIHCGAKRIAATGTTATGLIGYCA